MIIKNNFPQHIFCQHIARDCKYCHLQGLSKQLFCNTTEDDLSQKLGRRATRTNAFICSCFLNCTISLLLMHNALCTLKHIMCIFKDAQLPSQIWQTIACSFEEWQNFRERLKYCVVIGMTLSLVSSINVQFSI